MDNTQPVVLTRQSNDNQIRMYFEGVMRLSQSNEQFPVNLDEVWPLVYSRKSDAVESLKREFMENIDYQVLRQNPQNLTGGRPMDNYYLSLSCLEYFIARKVRSVFEVYRQVFHKVTQPKQLSTIDILELAVRGMRENQQQIEEVRQKVQEIDARTQTRPDYFTVVGYATINGFNVNHTLANKIGKKASQKCKEQGIPTDRVPDPRFGQVGMYPRSILREAFREIL